ncbi:endonuclease MutS2 [bacterium]|nr:endonuclease MutS2 [bacterium]
MEKYYLKLELDKIIQELENYCVTSVGKENLKDLKPSFNSTNVKHLLSETSQALNLQSEIGKNPISQIDDFKEIHKQLDSQMFLSCSNLLAVAHILKVSRELKNYYSNIQSKDNYSDLDSYFSSLYTNNSLEDRIFRSILDENTVADEASSALKSIRRKKQNLVATIKESLNKMVHSSFSKYVMDEIVTVRNDRYVIPVKIEYKDNVKGFVHDISFSGSTVFIEPTSIFDMNNQIQNLQIEENIEIENILKNISSNLIPICDNISNSVESIKNLDVIFAKANYSIEHKCTKPLINDKKIINLKSARHPLIDSNNVVPVSIEIGSKYSSLIITGPNTGGKTVSLKTTGLLCLMAYLGLFIPVDEGSSLFVFDNVFADIGDEQSIQESLSTFSSHMLNIIDIYNKATDKSLILVDELGSGTDPIEGANLAISILKYFHKIGAITLATTHYPEIKNYALVTDGFENASSEFDIENLKPTYRLLIGIPGKSNAFAITKRLGMPEEILNDAKSMMKNDNINIEELLKNIYDDKIEIEKEKDKIKKNSSQIDTLRKSLEEKTNALNVRETEIIEKAKIQSREMLLKAKQNANSIISELNELKTTTTNTSLKNANKLRSQLNEQIKDLYQTNNINSSENETDLNPESLTTGMNVFVKSFNKSGIILGKPNSSNEVLTQIGNIKINVKISDLTIDTTITKKYNNSNNKTGKTSRNNLKSKTVSTEINVIGQNVDEATFIIDKFLDDASLAGLKTVRIVHGKGTGKLRKGIHEFLTNHPHVANFRLGIFGEGEMGVTIVEIK